MEKDFSQPRLPNPYRGMELAKADPKATKLLANILKDVGFDPKKGGENILTSETLKLALDVYDRVAPVILSIGPIRESPLLKNPPSPPRIRESPLLKKLAKTRHARVN